MTPIDLLDYTDSSEKVPSELLDAGPREVEAVHPSTVIPAYLLDAFAVGSTATFVALILQLSVSNFMITPALRRSFEALDHSSLIISLTPLVLVSYFFFCFFFNQGQTWGMKQKQIRIEMPLMSFRSSLVWAIFSGTAIMTCGLSAITHHWLKSSQLGDFREHDYLYSQLIVERPVCPVNLVQLAGQNQDQRKQTEEHYQIAA